MNSDYLFATLGAIDDRIILAVADTIEHKKAKSSARKIIRIVFIAAMLAALLAACGYAVYRATMSYREPEPTDAMTYYINQAVEGNEHIEVNHGDCALALHFDTEETGLAHAFVTDNKTIPDLVCTGYTGTNSVWEFFHIFSDKSYVKSPICTPEKALKKSGLTRDEAEALYRNASFVRNNALDGEKIRVNLYDSPQLSQVDLILGWPEGTATVVSEDTWMEYQRLEVIIDRVWDSGRHDVNKHMFLFHPTEQYLISLSASDQDYSFEEMERVAASLELITIDIKYDLKNGGMNFSIADHGAG